MSKKKPKTSIYLELNNQCRRFLWFHNYKPNEMMFGICGLDNKQAILSLEFPEYNLKDSELPFLRYNWADAKEVNIPFDHITCHKDGTFQLKMMAGDKYIHKLISDRLLNADVPKFLEFIVLSDIMEYYKGFVEPEKPNICLGFAADECLRLRGAFSDINFDLKQNMAAAAGLANRPYQPIGLAFLLTSNLLQGFFIPREEKLIGDALKNRPRGTIVSFLFKTRDDSNIIKSFMFR